MWIITPIGFFSIVQKPGDVENATLTIRARVRSDLTELRRNYMPSLGLIQESADTDYRYRATAPRSVVAGMMTALVKDLKYSNFKNEVARRQGESRAHLYHEVWDALYKLQKNSSKADKSLVADSYGGVVISASKVLLREPTNHYGGYAWTFAKTEPKPGETPEATALRAVQEKTGYRARIRAELPPEFQSDSGTSRYFLMDADHPPERPDWQTSAARWVGLAEARELICRSKNAAGSKRDLAILDAAEAMRGNLPWRVHANVQPEDWRDLKPFAGRYASLSVFRDFDAYEMDNIRRGYFPSTMEEKWFIYFTGTRLKCHRSWTGILVFDLGFRLHADGSATLYELLVSRHSGDNGRTDDDENESMALELISNLLLKRLDAPVTDSFVEALTAATEPNYLGSPTVVSRLVGEVFRVTIDCARNNMNTTPVKEVIERVSLAFTDDGAGYQRMPSWDTLEQLGANINKYLIGPSTPSPTLTDALHSGFHSVATRIIELIQDFLQDENATWDDHALIVLNKVHEFVVAVLLGTNMLSHPGQTLKDLTWKSLRP